MFRAALDLAHSQVTVDGDTARCASCQVTAANAEVRAVLTVVISYMDRNKKTLRGFLHCYRLWTRSICEMGRKGWPGVDWSNLEQLV